MNPKLKLLCRGGVTSALMMGSLVLASPVSAHTGGQMMVQGMMTPAVATGADSSASAKGDTGIPALPAHGPGVVGSYGMAPGMMGGYGMARGMMGGYGMAPGMMGGYGMGPGMMGGYGMAPGIMGGYAMGPGMMGSYGMARGMMGGYGMGPGMMGGYAMGPGMMGGYGVGPGMMGGYAMGPGMMGGYGMARGMMGGYGMSPGMMGAAMMRAWGCPLGGFPRGLHGRGWVHGTHFARLSLARLNSPRAAAILGLSKAQQQKIDGILQAHEKSMTQAAAQLRANMLKLRQGLKEESPNTEALKKTYRKLADQRQKILFSGIDARGKLLKVLNNEQRKRLERMGGWGT